MTNFKIQKPGEKRKVAKSYFERGYCIDGPIFSTVFFLKYLTQMAFLILCQQIFMRVRTSKREWIGGYFADYSSAFKVSSYISDLKTLRCIRWISPVSPEMGEDIGNVLGCRLCRIYWGFTAG